jgi:tetraacyldisaccharide 4'-kinase
MQIRNTLYDWGLLPSFESRLCVLSVGNLTAGGNAKTPMCLYVTRLLKSWGLAPVILSRGYGGTEAGPLLVSEKDLSNRVGDEPLLLTRCGARVVVSKDRVAGAKWIESQGLGNVIILDDGFQHRRLHRNLNIVMAKLGNEKTGDSLSSPRLLPWGLFRELPLLALKRADVLVVVNRELQHEHLTLPQSLSSSIPPSLFVTQAGYKSTGVQQAGSKTLLLPPRQVVALSAIAHPEAFERSLAALGFSCLKSYYFPDHHHLRVADIEKISAEFGPEMPVVCTEKDLVKFSSIHPQLYVLPVELCLFPEDSFIDYLKQRLSGVLASVRENPKQ